MPARVIDHGYRAGYDLPNRSGGVKVEVRRVPRRKRDDPAVLRRRLEAGEWLLPGEVSALFGKRRWAADNWIAQGKIRYKRGPGGYRECHPEDVQRLLAEYDRVQGGKPIPTAEEPDVLRDDH